MKILLTGACGFVGRVLAEGLVSPQTTVIGIDNLSRAGSETNRAYLKKLGVRLIHGDIRSATDVNELPPADWVIDAAANPSVLAGVDGRTSSRQVIEHNLFGTVNLLEYCKRHRAGLIIISTSRVYSIAGLAALPLKTDASAFELADGALPAGVTTAGVNELFSTESPVSLYGATKLASENLALEYAEAFDMPVRINRCGVLSGAGQFGRADQGIFSFWIHSYRARRPLRYVGFGGHGHQVRDCMHPRDLVPLLRRQMETSKKTPSVVNASGGVDRSMSLAQLSDWCAERFGGHAVACEPEHRVFDVPWLVLDTARAAREWEWTPETKLHDILEEIALHSEQQPNWLDLADG